MLEKPYKTYNGGKTGAGTYQTIINQIPPIYTYIEPMLGGGGVYHRLRPANRIIINDIDKQVIDRYIFAGHAENAIITNLDYKQCLLKYAYNSPNCFVYFDPPYLLNTRSCQRPLYSYEWNDFDHSDFLEFALQLKCLVMISHYPSPTYDSALSQWRALDFQSMTRNGLRTERLYMNYLQPVKLHDYNYLGKDFTDRQRINRKVERLLQKLNHLPELERQALLTRINETFKS